MKVNKPKILRKIKIKDVLILFAVLGVLLVLGALVIGNNATPGNPLYWADRGIENIQTSITADPRRRIELNLKLMEERMNEQRIVTNDGAKTEELMNDFYNRLLEIEPLYKQLTDSGNNDANFALFIMENNIDSFERILEHRIENIKDTEIRKPIIRSYRAIQQEQDKIFDIAVNKVESNSKFDSYGRDYLRSQIRPIGNELEFALEDLGAISPQATETEVEAITAEINEAREIFFDSRDAVGARPNKDIHASFKQVNAILANINDELIAISQRGLEPVNTGN